jgi:hypothetical protein
MMGCFAADGFPLSGMPGDARNRDGPSTDVAVPAAIAVVAAYSLNATNITLT